MEYHYSLRSVASTILPSGATYSLSCSTHSRLRRATPLRKSVKNTLAQCIVMRYTVAMIINFRHKGLEAFYRTGTTKGIQPAHAAKLGRILGALDVASDPEDLNFPSFRLHMLKGDLKSFWSITVNGNWRVIFRFTGADVELVDYLDYH